MTAAIALLYLLVLAVLFVCTLRLGRLPPVRSWHQSVPLLLGCGLVWEVLAPLWKAGAVFDPWDLAAYQIGGIFFLILTDRQANRGGNS